MKTEHFFLKPLALVASLLAGCALSIFAQTAPTITTQPASQTNLPGTAATFSVVANGTGPFTYQWQFNGANLPNNIITTIAGTNVYGFSGDGGAATNAKLDLPSGMAFDAFGNLYIADRVNQRIRKVNTNGIITTVAGTNTAGYSGDGGAATNAKMTAPCDVALDAFGNLYFADYGNGRVRKVWLYAGYPYLTISQLAATNAGNYTVVISNPYGSVTSSVVSLTVTLPLPQIISSGASFGFRTNQFGFNLTSVAGQTIVVDASTNLVNWMPLFTNNANGSPFYFSDPTSSNFACRFCRARSQ